MKKSLDVLIWAILLFLITPSGMALASWNAVPGDATYSWKLSLEKVLIAILSPSDKLQSATQVKITERRFNEFEQIVESEYAIEGLKNLNEQIVVTTSNVQKIDQSESRSEVTEAYVDSLKKMSASLDEQKSKAKTGQITFATNQKTTTTSSKPSSSSLNPKSSTPTVKPSATLPATQPTAQPTTSQPSGGQATQAPQNPQEPQDSSAPVNPDEVIEQIEETQNNIEQVIKELEKIQEEEEEKGNKGNNALKDLSPEERKELIEKMNKMDKKEEKNDKKD